MSISTLASSQTLMIYRGTMASIMRMAIYITEKAVAMDDAKCKALASNRSV